MKMHGGRHKPEYHVWASMKQRCENPNNEKYPIYGARGITVCPEWTNDFGIFYADMGPRPKGFQLDRIDNDKGYYKENCRWASPSQNASNRSTTHNITFNGETMPVKHWAKKLGLRSTTIHERLRRGWTIEEALKTKLEKSRHWRWRW